LAAGLAGVVARSGGLDNLSGHAADRAVGHRGRAAGDGVHLGRLDSLDRLGLGRLGLLGATRAVGVGDDLGGNLSDGAVGHGGRALGNGVDAGGGLGDGLRAASGLGRGGSLADRADSGVQGNGLGSNVAAGRAVGHGGRALGNGGDGGGVDGGGGHGNRRGHINCRGLGGAGGRGAGRRGRVEVDSTGRGHKGAGWDDGNDAAGDGGGSADR
jgi:hypothetical protein